MKLSRANCSAANSSESLRTARFSRVIATRNLLLFALVCVGLAYWLGLNSSALAAGSTPAKPTALNPPHASQAIPWSQFGARAGADYQGDGLTVTPIAEGARFRCVFQRLAGEVTREGLWLTSTVPDAGNERFRVRAAAVGRGLGLVGTSRCDVPARVVAGGTVAPLSVARTAQRAVPTASLPTNGTVQVVDKLVRFIRPGLIEEYSVSMDGVRQDFIIEQRPAGEGELRVELDVLGAKVEPLPDSVRLVLENSGRNIAYSRLRVTDATGKELTARMDVASGILPDVEGAHPAARNLAADFSTTLVQDTPESARLEARAL